MRGTTQARTRITWLLAATPLVVLLTHYAAVLPHEFAHSIVAWLVGIKDQPGNIDWGGTGLLNIFLLIDIYENVEPEGPGHLARPDLNRYHQDMHASPPLPSKPGPS